jgi:hypothetical protein
MAPYKALWPVFFLAAHRAFIRADNFLFIAGLIGFRPSPVLTFLGTDLPFCLAHRAFYAADILARADALIVRRFRAAACNP